VISEGSDWGVFRTRHGAKILTRSFKQFRIASGEPQRGGGLKESRGMDYRPLKGGTLGPKRIK